MQPGLSSPRWPLFSLGFALAGLALAAALGALVFWADPYGMRVRVGSAPPVLMDSNQRFMYPQIVRAGQFDAVVIGTSSTRLLEPQRLSGLMKARFANLAMNAATPWEQSQMMALVQANIAAPKAVIWGLDATWCASDADAAAKRLTPRIFPDWLYQSGAKPPAPTQWRHMANLTTLEIAGRRLFHALGRAPERMRADGYDEFTPPDATYDITRARFHIYQGRKPLNAADYVPDVPIGPHAQANAHFPALAFPALAWLEQALAAMPPSTRKLIVLPPLHAASLPAGGNPTREADADCKLALVALSQRVQATVLDYRVVSPLTVNDSAFWDPLHYRVAVAQRIERDIASADSDGTVSPQAGLVRHWQGR